MKNYVFEMYELRYEPWSAKCIFNEKSITPYDLDHKQGRFAAYLKYHSDQIETLCIVLFSIVAFELLFIYAGKEGQENLDGDRKPAWLSAKCVNKIIVLRRIVCIVIAKVSLIIVSTMSVATNTDQFVYLGKEECT